MTALDYPRLFAPDYERTRANICPKCGKRKRGFFERQRDGFMRRMPVNACCCGTTPSSPCSICSGATPSTYLLTNTGTIFCDQASSPNRYMLNGNLINGSFCLKQAATNPNLIPSATGGFLTFTDPCTYLSPLSSSVQEVIATPQTFGLAWWQMTIINPTTAHLGLFAQRVSPTPASGLQTTWLLGTTGCANAVALSTCIGTFSTTLKNVHCDSPAMGSCPVPFPGSIVPVDGGSSTVTSNAC